MNGFDEWLVTPPPIDEANKHAGDSRYWYKKCWDVAYRAGMAEQKELDIQRILDSDENTCTDTVVTKYFYAEAIRNQEAEK